eukprot:m.124846 g.124846  ORF g.124846 m.124846 type:complete len:1100 (+) comp12965_c0_seq4:167-3466(+)
MFVLFRSVVRTSQRSFKSLTAKTIPLCAYNTANAQTHWRNQWDREIAVLNQRTLLHLLIAPTNNDDQRVAEMITWFQDEGHLVAKLDPLMRRKRGIWGNEMFHEKPQLNGTSTDNLLLWMIEKYPWAAEEKEKGEWLCGVLGIKREKAHELMELPMMQYKRDSKPSWRLHELFEHLVEAYAGTLGCEFSHLDLDQQFWIMNKMENKQPFSGPRKRRTLQRLMRTHLFESFLSETFPSSKKFGIEGCESFIPGLETLIRRCGELGTNDIFMGMSHRGRLSLLHTIMGKSMGAIGCEMLQQQSDFHIGDVIYHQGLATQYTFDRLTQKRILPSQDLKSHDVYSMNLTLCPNPSHLEAVNPVVLGITRAFQSLTQDTKRSNALPLLIHGDAAFSGLGIVHETMQLSLLDGYSVGGTIHIVINNQIGYTTPPFQAHSSTYATDVAKAALAPVFHVNADDVEAVCRACDLAAEFRAEFHHDVVVDIVGYRRRGHNELDDPTTTLPKTYEIVKQKKDVLELYTEQCVKEGVVSPDDVTAWKDELAIEFSDDHCKALEGEYSQSSMDFLADAVVNTGIVNPQVGALDPTGLPLDRLQLVGHRACDVSAITYSLHPSVKALMKKRERMLSNETSRVDWGMAEILAFGSLAMHRSPSSHRFGDGDDTDPRLDTYHVRLTGQDCERGTFNQRHAAVYDQNTAKRFVPLANFLPGKQSHVEVWNSPLNEAAVLAYEYGASIGFENKAVVMWEAQFGDFANNAQGVIDQFISSGEERWGQKSNIVLLLPHGYDGLGPDHSSARIERYLQMMNDDSDHLPGRDPNSRKLIEWTFDALGEEEYVSKEKVFELLNVCVEDPAEALETMWMEMCLSHNQEEVPRRIWEQFMTTFLRRNAEHTANMFILNCTTPAQYFHALRRQAKRPYKKPLIIITPKYLLHHKPCSSALGDFGPATFFRRVIEEGKDADNLRHMAPSFLLPNEEIKRVVLCSGQVFYKLFHERNRRQAGNVCFVRLEQIAPFPHDRIIDAIGNYPNAEIVWCQEEPKNMGAWFYVRPRLEAALKEYTATNGLEYAQPMYKGRPVSASTATASFTIHKEEEQTYLEAALTIQEEL